ncbi:Uncharacterised protein [uncultured archaeon]|nr:Uncharacterised protein [uncultured archaeon]
MRFLYADFESRAAVDPFEVGLYNYIQASEPLFLWWALDNQTPRCWRLWEDPLVIDSELMNALLDPSVNIVAFNSAFERYMFRKIGWDLPTSRFLWDPQVGGRYLSLPASLSVQGEVLDLPHHLRKDKRGDALIGLFCHPVVTKPTKKNPTPLAPYYNDWVSHPKEWQEFLDYGKSDILAERELLRRMQVLGAMPLPPFEQRLWLFDQKVNDRGMPVDKPYVEKMYRMALRAKAEAKADFEAFTGVKNANSPTQVKAWAKTQGYPLKTLKKDAVTSVLKDPVIKLTDACRKALEMRGEAASTSYQKLGAILANISPDGRLRNQFIFLGSSRCGRWSGNAVQLHNLARPLVVGGYDFEDQKVVKEAREFVYREDFEGMKAKYGSVLLVIKSLIRTVFVAEVAQ